MDRSQPLRAKHEPVYSNILGYYYHLREIIIIIIIISGVGRCDGVCTFGKEPI